MGSKSLLFLIVLLISSTFAYSATLHGAVYDSAYNLISDVQIEINTTPKQSHISKNGAYFFFVPLGEYKITAEKFYQKELIFTANKTMKVNNDGEFQVDIIVEGLIVDDIPEEENAGPSFFSILRARFGIMFFVGLGLLFLILLVVIFLSIRFFVTRRVGVSLSMGHDDGEEQTTIKTGYSIGQTPDEDLTIDGEERFYTPNTVLRVIKEEGGRTTQKDIRKKIPLSEAKVSLMISELESQGKVKKIKKGRGNIIVLNE